MKRHRLRALRARLALRIAPWLRPQGSTELRRSFEAKSSTFNAPTELTWHGSWADRVG